MMKPRTFLMHVALFFPIAVMTVFALNPMVAIGQGVPATPENAIIACDGVEKKCDFEQLMALIQKIIDLLFFAATFVATAMFMYAGFLYLTAFGNTVQIQKAHGIFRKVFVGFMIMFLAFIIVRNLLKLLGADEFLKIVQ